MNILDILKSTAQGRNRLEELRSMDAPENKKYTVDCFTPQSEGGKFPDNSYSVDTVEEVGDILNNVSRPTAGISKVEIFILENADADLALL